MVWCYCSGLLDDKSKPIIFSMARLDKVKNITGLVECYAKNAKLRELANLVVVAGYNDAKKSNDREEIVEIEKMHELMKQYKLHGQMRWLSSQTNRARNGELYRYIADKRGIFVQVCACSRCFITTVIISMLIVFNNFISACILRSFWTYCCGGHDLWSPNICYLPWRPNGDY